MIWVIPAALAAAGAIKGYADQRAAGKKRAAEAEIARWSPWTGMAAQRVDDGPGIIGGAIQGGLQGVGAAQAWQNANTGKSPDSTSSGQALATPQTVQPQPMLNSPWLRQQEGPLLSDNQYSQPLFIYKA